MDEPLANVSRPASPHAGDPVPTESPGARRRRPGWVAVLFLAACVASGLFTAVLVGFLMRETLGEPIGLLLAVSGAAGVLTALGLFQLARQRLCDRAIVMGGGLASAVMCSMMFLD